MAHQRVTGHISTGDYPTYYGSGGGAIQRVLTNVCGLLIVLVVYTLCGALALQSVELQRSLGDAAVQDSTLESVI